jgi:hypothetical protein
MALGTAAAGGIVPRTAVFVAIAARFNSRKQNVGGLATVRRPGVARRASQQAMGIVVELGVQEPARRN